MRSFIVGLALRSINVRGRIEPISVSLGYF